jgi:hypothetical protein
LDYLPTISQSFSWWAVHSESPQLIPGWILLLKMVNISISHPATMRVTRYIRWHFQSGFLSFLELTLLFVRTPRFL